VGKFGTFAGLCIHLSIKYGLVPLSVVRYSLRHQYFLKKKFANMFNLSYAPGNDVVLDDMTRLLNLYSYTVHTYYHKVLDLDRIADLAVRIATKRDEGFLGHLVDDWIQFKRRERFLDFEDFHIIVYNHEVPLDTEVLIIDEFQDISPLQYEIVKNWLDGKSLVMFAGDDDQTVMGPINGANPDIILGVEADQDIVLKKSFRLPAEVHKWSVKVIETFVKNRYPKEFEPLREGGVVQAANLGLEALIKGVKKLTKDGLSVMVLTRTNYEAKEIMEHFLMAGIRFERFKETKASGIWPNVITPIVNVFEAVLKNRRVSEEDFKRFVNYVKAPQKVKEAWRQAFKNSGAVPLDLAMKIRKAYNDRWVFNYLFNEEALRNVVGSYWDVALDVAWKVLKGRLPPQKAPVYVDTMHAAKGREADVVILLDNVTPRIKSDIMMDGFEDEVRVWYVGMTRAKVGILLVPYGDPFLLGLMRRVGYGS